MAKLNFKKGTTSKLVHVFIQDATQTNGAGLTGLLYNTASLTAYYFLEGATSSVAISLSAGSLGTWSSGGFVAVDGTNLPGLYELGLPNAALTGANSVKVMLKGAANMLVAVLEIQLDATDNQDAVRGGMTALPNANASAAGGLPTFGTGAGQINPTAGSVPVSSIPASALVASGLVTYVGAVADGASTTTVVDSSISTANGDLFSGQAIVFLSGPLQGKAAHIQSVTVYNTSFYQLILSTTLPSAPGNGVQFALLPWSKALVLFAANALGTDNKILLSTNAQTGVTIPSVTSATTVGSVTGSVGSISGVTFPANFSTFSVDSSGHVTLTTTEHTAIQTDAATGILVTPGNKLATNSSGQVTTTYPIRVNTAFPNFTFSMVSSTDHVTPKTGAAAVGQVALNGGAFANLANAVSEVGSGAYKINLAAGDLNGADVMLRFTASGADPVVIKLILNA